MIYQNKSSRGKPRKMIYQNKSSRGRPRKTASQAIQALAKNTFLDYTYFVDNKKLIFSACRYGRAVRLRCLIMLAGIKFNNKNS